MKEVEIDGSLIQQQDLMLAEFTNMQKVTSIGFEPFGTFRFVVPQYEGAKERVIELNDTNTHEKCIIFSALYTASYVTFVLNEGATSDRQSLSSIVPKFIDFLNETNFDKFNRVNILKKFEAYRVENDGVKTQSTGLLQLTRLLNKALNHPSFNNDLLTPYDYKYLDLLSKSKAAASDNEEQTTLTDYLGFHSWLVREDVGVGAELYRRAASPKLLMSSFMITISTALEQINNSKHAIIDMFRSANIKIDYLPTLSPVPKACDYKNGKDDEDFKKASSEHKVETLNYKKGFFEKMWFLLLDYNKTESIEIAIDSLIHSQCNEVAHEFTKDVFWKQGIIPQQTSKISKKIVTIFKQSTNNSLLFTPDFIVSLLKYVNSDESVIPISSGENYLFSLLMAYQTVPYSDIYRISSSDFRLAKKQNGEVSMIESDYFKSRAGRVHETETVTASSSLGKAILCFLKDKTSNFNKHAKLVEEDSALQAKLGITSSISVFYNFLAKSVIRNVIDKNLLSKKCSPVFIECVHMICTVGVRKDIFERNNVNWALNCETPCLTRIFSSQAVKNSRVHSESDSFDPTRIINHLSHSNETERKSYLNTHNKTWEDNCGRTTRLVMNDIELNVLRPSRTEISIYNQDFKSALSLIKNRAENTLSRLKVISNKNGGKVDEFGLLSSPDLIEGDLPDTVYLTDTSETVLKLLHYVSEVERCHHTLLQRSPEFLFYTVLPTVEWIETVFSNRLLSRNIVTEGQKLYAKTKEHLPPMFTAFTGGY
jgi:hypothetical protein